MTIFIGERIAEMLFFTPYRGFDLKAFVRLRHLFPFPHYTVWVSFLGRMEDLEQDEYLDMWTSVRMVQTILKEHYQATAFNVAVQDGQAAGQSVPHVHVHILPRKGGDFERNDDVYEELDAWAPRSGLEKPKTTIDVPDDADRQDRTIEIMAEEAAVYNRILDSLKE
jgi:bis(5'-adenosyl)-triphosphatase